MKCIFDGYGDQASCRTTATKPEHYIQEAIGGTRTSLDVICDSCNEALGSEVDAELAQHFRPLISDAALGARAALRHKPIQISLAGHSARALLTPGGVVALGKIYQERSADGSLLATYGPPSQVENMRRLWAKEAPGERILERDVPFTELTGERPERIERRRFGTELSRAVMKTCLETVDEIARRDQVDLFRRDNSLAGALRFIRQGQPHAVAHRISSPMVSVGDLLDGAFAAAGFAEAGRFSPSTRIAVVSDGSSRRLYGFLSVCGTMPLGCCLSENWPLPSWTLLVNVGLVAGDGERSVWLPRAILRASDVEWRRFVARSQASIDFARTKYHQAYALAQGELIVRNDEHLPSLPLETIAASTLPDRPRESFVSGTTKGIVEALRLRFLQNHVPGSEWERVEGIVRERLDADHDVLVHSVFLEMEKRLAKSFGVPTPQRQLGYAKSS